MSLFKRTKDQFLRFFLGKSLVPRGLFELQSYLRSYTRITFKVERTSDGGFVAVSQDFKYGSIVASARDENELLGKIQDAVLTAFAIPSSYAKEANTTVGKLGDQAGMYAAA